MTPEEQAALIEQEVQAREQGRKRADALALACIIVALALVGVGAGVWLHPGAGLAGSGIILAIIGVLIGRA